MLRPSTLWRVMTPRSALQVLALGHSSEITQSVIKKAYIRQTLKCHPDLNPDDPNANEKFRMLSDALRVALRALEMKSAASPLGVDKGCVEVDVNDSQAALEALRRAVVVYRLQRALDVHQPRTCHDPKGHGDGHDPMDDVFFSPSLEYLSRVCKEESLAMRRIQTFCEDLPAVLSGSSSAALFEAVAFFHPRYVQSMSACVMRFSQNLNVIVRRVVKNRKKYVSYRQSKWTSGIGTGTRPREQKLEDMTMKPLVLMGALIFNLPKQPQTNNTPMDGEELDADISSTCGATRPDDVEVAEDLKCVIDPTDSIGSITEKLGKWEAASYERLKLELANVDVCTLLSGMLGLEEGGHQLTTSRHVQCAIKEVECVSRVLQTLACGVCYHLDPAVDHTVTNTMVEEICAATVEKSIQDDEAAASLPLAELIAQCRKLGSYLSTTLKGNTLLTWKESAIMAEAGTPDVPCRGDGELHEEYQRPPEVLQNGLQFRVARHWACCSAESIEYAMSIELSSNLKVFLLRLRKALKTVGTEANASRAVLSELLQIRERSVKEEFIPQRSPDTSAGTPLSDQQVSQATELHPVDDENITFRHRGPIFCFPRIYNMSTVRELQFWKLVHQHREYVSRYAQAMNPINLYYNCSPYGDGKSTTMNRPQSPENLVAGWIGDATDGCDNALLTSDELDNPQAFQQWLEDIVEQSSLNRECQLTLSRARVGYVQRHPALPLANFLSFVKLFVSSLAVRGVLEGHSTAKSSPIITPDDVGLVIVVGTRCDVRNGGQLLIPWHMDPVLLLSLLGEMNAPHQLPSHTV